ncbi:MAG: CIA30 family protein [Rhodobacter sp.]|nr:CIA30 family protein [Rhodobacter sp.]
MDGIKTMLRGAALALLAGPALAGAMMLEDFTGAPETRWDYVSDQVMGGVSEGAAAFEAEDGTAFVRLTGGVSTANNGGFIQVRQLLSEAFPAGSEGVAIRVRGNGERYFVHLRTTATTRPWYYYQAAFEAGPDWQNLRLPLAAFAPSNAVLPATIDPATVTSIGIVAFGRDHQADVSVASVEVY